MLFDTTTYESPATEAAPVVTVPTKWTAEELEAAVRAYFDMRSKATSGTKFVKSEYYKDLSKTYGRSVKSYEYRMQNISFVCDQLGMGYVPGLKPAKNVGKNVVAEITRIIESLQS